MFFQLEILTCVCIQTVCVLGRFLCLSFNGQRAGDICPVTTSTLPVVHAAHVHDVVVHPPAQEPIGQGREEAPVTGQIVSGEDVRVWMAGHGEEGVSDRSLYQGSQGSMRGSQEMMNVQLFYSLWGMRTFIFWQQFSVCTIILLYWDYILFSCTWAGDTRSYLWILEAGQHSDRHTHTFNRFLLVKSICRLCTLTLVCHTTCLNVRVRHCAESWSEKICHSLNKYQSLH